MINPSTDRQKYIYFYVFSKKDFYDIFVLIAASLKAIETAQQMTVGVYNTVLVQP